MKRNLLTIIAILLVFLISYVGISFSKYNNSAYVIESNIFESESESLIESIAESKEEIPLNIRNDNKRKYLNDKYGITIYYGSEYPNYTVIADSLEPLSDETSIMASLNRLERLLSKYPDGLFKEMRDSGFPVQILLVKNFEGIDNLLGVTDTRNTDHAVITTKYTSKFEYTFNHEMMHYLDRYMMLKKGVYPENTWNSLNPKDFKYGQAYDSIYEYDKKETDYFISLYSESSFMEDRAEVFASMMETNVTYYKCFRNGNPLYFKASKISEALNTYFSSYKNNPEDYFDRFKSIT